MTNNYAQGSLATNVRICRIGRASSGEIQPLSDARLLAAWVGISPNIEP
jgi:hypothetical protein